MSNSLINSTDRISPLHKALLLLASQLLFAHVFISLYTILVHSVAVVSRDQWFMYEAFFNSSGWFDSVFRTFSNHLTLIPNLFFYLDFNYFSASNQLLLYTSFLNLVFIAYIIISKGFEYKTSLYERVLLCCWSAFCLFYLNTFALQGWAFIGTQHYLTFSFLLIAIYFYQRFELYSANSNPLFHFIPAFFLLLATFCFGGFLVWPTFIAAHLFFRGKPRYLLVYFLILFVCLVFYFQFSGDQSISTNTAFSLKHALVFYFSLLSSPIFYILRVFNFFDPSTLKILLIPVGFAFFLSSIFLLYKSFKDTDAYSLPKHIFLSFLFIGLGAPLVIIIFRNPVFWDPFVDRYQIWASCFYLGLPSIISLKNKPVLYGSFFLFILLIALPSQVQLSQRVIDYRQNVSRGLIDYSNGFADSKSLQETLHFGWEKKLETFSFVHRTLQSRDLNYYSYHSSLPVPPNYQQFPSCKNIHVVQKKTRELVLPNPQANLKPARFYLQAPGKFTQIHILNEGGAVIGEGRATHNSFLPRNLLKWKWEPINAYASTAYADQAALMVLSEENGNTGCISRFPGK